MRKSEAEINQVLIGVKFGRLTVLKTWMAQYGKARRAKYLCRCDCGKEREVWSHCLKSGHTKSCGCLHREGLTKRLTKHGLSKTPTWAVWFGMLARCQEPNNASFKHYGGRGIKVCDRWSSDINGFQNFLADMGERPGGDYQLDREDNNGGYEPGNCRWVTGKVNCRNKRNNRLITHAGEAMCLSAWAERLGLSKNCLHARLKNWSVERALATPLKDQ